MNNKKIKFNAIINPYDKKYWEDNIATEIETKLNEYISNSIDDSLIQERQFLFNEFQEANKRYKNDHNKFLYFVIILLIILVFFLFVLFPLFFPLNKKFKVLKEKKDKLLEDIAVSKRQVLDVNKKIVNSIKIKPLVKDIIVNKLHYTNYGYISDELINTISSLSTFDLKNTEEENTFNSSWGIFNNNIVIIHAKQKHSIFNKTYTGSTRVSYYSDGELKYETVTASYDHPCVKIDKKETMWCFSEYTENLTFKFVKYYSNKWYDKKRKKITSISFENTQFEAHYRWSWNDDQQIRMVFTPYFQENFLAITNSSNPPDNFKLKKIKSFYSSEYIAKYNNHFLSWLPAMSNFSTNINWNFEKFTKGVVEDVKSFIYDKYLELSFMTIIPIIQSEDQSHLVNYIFNLQKQNKQNCSELKVHYILNEILNVPLFKLDTDTMHYPTNINFYNYGFPITVINLSAYSYNMVNKVEYVSANGPNGMVSVPVDYVDYIRQDQEGTLAYMEIDNKDLYYWSVNDNNQQILQILNNTKASEIVVQDGYIVILGTGDFSNISDDLHTIYNYVSNNRYME